VPVGARSVSPYPEDPRRSTPQPPRPTVPIVRLPQVRNRVAWPRPLEEDSDEDDLDFEPPEEEVSDWETDQDTDSNMSDSQEEDDDEVSTGVSPEDPEYIESM
jgi:hypothetical protein